MFTRGKPKEESFFLIFREQKKRDYNLLVPEIKNVLNGKKLKEDSRIQFLVTSFQLFRLNFDESWAKKIILKDAKLLLKPWERYISKKHSSL